MKNKIAATIFFSLITLSNIAHSGEKIPVGSPSDFSKCEDDLRSPNAYNDYDGFKYIVLGKEGWFFRTAQDFKQDFSISEENTELFRKVTGAFKSKGTSLIIAYPPTRGIAASDKLPDDKSRLEGYNPLEARKAYAELITDMRSKGVNIAGNPDAQSRYFYKADLHWTSEGALQMAEAVASVAKELESYNKIPKHTYQNVSLPSAPDEQKFNGPLRAICKLKAEPEMAELNTTKQVDIEKGENGLFSNDAFPEVILVGTSNSNRDDNDLNFSGRLKEKLSVDVLNQAIAGGGIDDAILSYLISGQFESHPPKLIVWEIPGYYNLGGEEMNRALRQILPAIRKRCSQELVKMEGALERKKEKALAENVAVGGASPVYLQGTFGEPLRKKVTFTLHYQSGKDVTLKIEKSRAPNKENSFYYAIKPRDDVIKSISATSFEEDTVRVTAKMCPLE